MKAVLLKRFGDPQNLYLGDWEKPSPKPNELLVKVHATALNRADTMQRKGQYPPPKGDSPILGLEIAGTVEAIGKEVADWQINDQVCGLIGGGGYAEYAVIPARQALPIPKGLSFEQAAGIPEVFLTAFQAINWIGKLQKDETILIHAGASGVGTAAIQIAKAIGAKVIVTASKGKHETCLQLGAAKTVDYQSENFEEIVKEYTDGRGVDLIIDFIAAPYLQQNLNSLNFDGRLVLLALMGGYKLANLNMLPILFRRIQIFGSTLRARTLDYKGKLTKDLYDFAWPLFEKGVFKPVIDSIYDWNKVIAAHEYMEANKNIGKIILRIRS
ncbi:MAG: NAD(P)H-quinone oxidoreductase [Bacteroidota bacterium]